jgi:L-seryl-tRNA(Ser) seleniumtransferase
MNAHNVEILYLALYKLVEIGGSFRISSIMEESGAKLVEVGNTNKPIYMTMSKH